TVTSLVNDWVNNGFTNNGIVLLSTGTDGGDAAYASHEDPTAANEPTLTVNWTQAVNPAPGTTTTLTTQPLLLTGSGQITVTMTVSAAGSVPGVTPPVTLTVNVGGGITASKASGPTPAGPVNISAGSPATFIYVYNVTPGAVVDEISFSGKPTSASVSFNTA